METDHQFLISVGSYEGISLSCLDTCAGVQITYGGKSLRKWLYMCYWCIKVRHGRRLQSCQNTACRSVRDRSQLATTSTDFMLSEMGCMVTSVRHGRRLRSCQNTACRSVRDRSQLATTTLFILSEMGCMVKCYCSQIMTQKRTKIIHRCRHVWTVPLFQSRLKKRTTGAGCFQISWAPFSAADWLRNRAILFSSRAKKHSRFFPVKFSLWVPLLCFYYIIAFNLFCVRHWTGDWQCNYINYILFSCVVVLVAAETVFT